MDTEPTNKSPHISVMFHGTGPNSTQNRENAPPFSQYRDHIDLDANTPERYLPDGLQKGTKRDAYLDLENKKRIASAIDPEPIEELSTPFLMDRPETRVGKHEHEQDALEPGLLRYGADGGMDRAG